MEQVIMDSMFTGYRKHEKLYSKWAIRWLSCIWIGGPNRKKKNSAKVLKQRNFLASLSQTELSVFRLFL